MNVFDKTNEQNDACINSAMAKKGGFKETNVFDKTNEQNDACINSAMAKKGGFKETKKILLTLLLLSISLVSSHAYDYSYLTFETTDGNAIAINVEGLTLSISSCCLVAVDSDGSDYTFAFSNLSKMYFSDDATGVQPLSPDSEEAVEAYTTDGRLIGRYVNAVAAKAALSKGVYVLKSKSLTFKISLP